MFDFKKLCYLSFIMFVGVINSACQSSFVPLKQAATLSQNQSASLGESGDTLGDFSDNAAVVDSQSDVWSNVSYSTLALNNSAASSVVTGDGDYLIKVSFACDGAHSYQKILQYSLHSGFGFVRTISEAGDACGHAFRAAVESQSGALKISDTYPGAITLYYQVMRDLRPFAGEAISLNSAEPTRFGLADGDYVIQVLFNCDGNHAFEQRLKYSRHSTGSEAAAAVAVIGQSGDACGHAISYSTQAGTGELMVTDSYNGPVTIYYKASSDANPLQAAAAQPVGDTPVAPPVPTLAVRFIVLTDGNGYNLNGAANITWDIHEAQAVVDRMTSDVAGAVRFTLASYQTLVSSAHNQNVPAALNVANQNAVAGVFTVVVGTQNPYTDGIIGYSPYTGSVNAAPRTGIYSTWQIDYTSKILLHELAWNLGFAMLPGGSNAGDTYFAGTDQAAFVQRVSGL